MEGSLVDYTVADLRIGMYLYWFDVGDRKQVGRIVAIDETYETVVLQSYSTGVSNKYVCSEIRHCGVCAGIVV